MPVQLTDDQVADWMSAGYVRLGRVASADELGGLRERIDDLMLGRAPNEHIWFQRDSATGRYEDVKFGDGKWEGPTLGYRKIEWLERDDRFGAYVRHETFRGICADLIGRNISIYRAMFMNKPAGKGTVLPWHQDAGSPWGLSKNPYVTIWTALDDATIENGCVEIVPGTHKLGLLSEQGHTITPEQEAEHCPEGKRVFLEMEAGEAVLLNNLLLHRSGVNRTERPRRAFSVVYMDAATKDVSGRDRPFPVAFEE